ncbi:fibulin-1 isoform X1 [Chiloscyllium plagiosum]|uniref:fibulin-1 isoform X1 n=1 Tax=Chiloscyllium plagiosum TaxID=36176 RepID=UPI001CB7CE48|nr:fibulin-1 isoform X1 [Chiloscyllium plagiosum]
MDFTARILMMLFSLLLFSLQVTVQSSINACCSNGLEWASEKGDCASLPYTLEEPFCRIAQEECCWVKLEEMHCAYGINMARENHACEVHSTNSGNYNMIKKCCQCCLLGKGAKANGLNCEANPALGYQCGQVYRACCVGDQEDVSLPDAGNNIEGLSTTAMHNQSTGSSQLRKPLLELEDPFLNDRCRGGGPCQQRCTDTVTSVDCSCFDGYKLRSDNVTCEDINECLSLPHPCQAGQRCINTIGSYQCLREIGCGTGYELTENNQCKDINECEIGTHNCGSNFVCQNTQGSFRCRPKMQCGTGFLQDALGNCIDINECTNTVLPCQVGYTCINSIGSYSCKRNVVNCGRGYRLSADGSHCADIDECVGLQNPCGEGHSCINSPGSFHCDCKIGYYFNSISRTCVDENECRRYPGRLCAHNCENTPGSYYCSCSKGFKLSADARNCEDVNECEHNPCSQECANVYGSYQCYCRRGYQLSDADGITCEDIDECALPAGGNICSYRCVNTPGSFQCACPVAGYTLASNGRNCQDINECITGRHNCSGTETCFNVQGSFRCLTFECPENYQKSRDVLRVDSTETVRCIKSCRPGDTRCILDPVNTVSYTVISLPTYREFLGPIEIIFLRAASPAFPNVQPEIVFHITEGNIRNSFDIIKRYENTITIGVVRLVKPIIGPFTSTLKLEMDYYLTGQLSHRNIVYVTIYISEYWF